jgi:hypothetical protein
MSTSLRSRIAIAVSLSFGALGVVAACATSSVSTIPDCASGEERCNGVCTNVSNDNANCGTCGKACATGEVCSQKACGLSCTGGTSNCGGKCVDTKSDPANCGVCGSKCANGDLCSAGKCAKNCTGGTTLCNGTCIDTSSDDANCGACGTTCKAGEKCGGGKCASICTGGLSYCAPQVSDGGVSDAGNDASSDGGAPLGCVNLQTDYFNCGQCNLVCGAGKECKAGLCVAAPVIGVGTDPDPYRLSSGTQPISCKAFKTAYPNQGDGIYLIRPSSTDIKVYCDMTNGAWTYESFGFGKYNQAYSGWTFVGAPDFSGSAQFRAAFEYLYNRDRLINIQPGWTSGNCCFMNTTNTNFYGFAGNTYMYPANQTGTSFNCNGTYSDPKMRLYLVTSAVVRDAFTQQELVNPGIYASCTVSNNPAIFVKRYQ